MELGLFGLHRGSSADPGVLVRRAQRAEAAGFESLWVGDHIALPAGDPDDTGNPGDEPRLEALSTLAFLAGVTTRVRLAAGLDLDKTATALAALREVTARGGRRSDLRRLEITVTPPGIVDLGTARRYADLGVDRLAIQPDEYTASAMDELIDLAGNTLIGRI